MNEYDMQNQCYNQLKNLNIYKEVILEVPFLSRCIDMVLITNDSKVISIEFKLNKWRDAIEQAKDHKQGADESYICLPKRKLTKKLKSELEENGIGLFFYEPEYQNPLKEIIPAQYSKSRWLPLVNGFKDTINKIAEKEVII